ncbi:hypothetical protein SUDANB176_00786 [Streptomyces sp. enrichment culture]|uniref:MMPL family transporter n=1 Tax=Streptomyces sp. enrichment culture TaxID=1795815 RepID=UPI003F54C492
MPVAASGPGADLGVLARGEVVRSRTQLPRHGHEGLRRRQARSVLGEDSQATVPALQGTLEDLASGGPVRACLTGPGALNAAVVEQQDKDIAQAEQSIGLPIALVVLLLAFGTLLAAGLHPVPGAVALLTTFGVPGVLTGAGSDTPAGAPQLVDARLARPFSSPARADGRDPG